MSERTFFNMRYVFSGFMFYIGFLLWAQIFIFDFFKDKFDLGIGILSVVGLPPIGFLFAEIWNIPFLIYRFRFRKFRDSTMYFLNENGFPSKSHDGKRYRIINLGINEHFYLIRRCRENIRLLHMRDYVYHYYLSLIRNKVVELDYIRTYLTRRWDLINTIGSGVISYFFGLYFGCLFLNMFLDYHITFFDLPDYLRFQAKPCLKLIF